MVDTPKPETKPKPYELYQGIKGDVDFNLFKFISRGISKEKSARDFEKVIHVEIYKNKKYIVVTDGRRIYLAETNHPIEEGNYHVEKNVAKYIKLVPCDLLRPYPKWSRYMEYPIEKVGKIDLYSTSLTRNVNANQKASVEFEYLVRTTNKLVNIRFVDDLPKLDWDFYKCKNNKLKHITLKATHVDRDLRAIIMPIARRDYPDEEEEKNNEERSESET
jgi:DNA polymerase III sliding clamp (beta) subunit (PCNA family)